MNSRTIYAIDDSSREIKFKGREIPLYLTSLLSWESPNIRDYERHILALKGPPGKSRGSSIGYFLSEYLTSGCLLIACFHYRMYGEIHDLVENIGCEIRFLGHRSKDPRKKYYGKADYVASRTSRRISYGLSNGGVNRVDLKFVESDKFFADLLGLPPEKILIP